MKKGFTLVELVIVIVIVGILSIVAVPIYRGYVEKAKTTEGMALAGAVRQAEMIYYAEHGEYYTDEIEGSGASTQYNEVLGIDARGNKYYNHFYVALSGGAVAAWAHTNDKSNDKYVGIDIADRQLLFYDPKTGTYEVVK